MVDPSKIPRPSSIATNLKKLGFFALGLDLITNISSIVSQSKAGDWFTLMVVAVAKYVASVDLKIGELTASVLANPITDYGMANLHRYYALAVNLFIFYVVIFGVSVPIVNRRIGIFGLIDSFIINRTHTQTLNFYILVGIFLGGLLWAFAYVEHIPSYTPFSGVYALGRGLLSSPQAFFPFIK